MSKFTKMNHFTDGEGNLRLRRNAVLVPRGRWKCKLVRVCRCRIGWRRPENQRKFERLLRKPTEQIEQGTVQSSTGDGCPASDDAGRSCGKCNDTINDEFTEMETEDQFNIECHKLLAGIFDRHGTIVDMERRRENATRADE